MGKTVRGFLVMWESTHGSWTIPTSEQAYRAYGHIVDGVLPSHGGILQPAAGTWTRHSSIGSDFSAYVLSTARDEGKTYLPSCIPYGSDPARYTEFLTLLGLPANWAAIADGLVELALTSFDSPWSGVLYDWPDLPLANVVAHEQFVTVLSDTVRAAGLPFGVAYLGNAEDEAWQPSLDVLRDICDFFDYYMYTYWGAPYSPSPYWWCRASVANALAHGFDASHIYLGVPVFAWYQNTYIKHSQGMQLIANNNATLQWMENHATGLIREKYASVGGNDLWIEDGETLRARLELVNDYDLGGVVLFVLGCESNSTWRAIRNWKYGLPQGIQRAQKIHGSGGLFSRG